MLCIF